MYMNQIKLPQAKLPEGVRIMVYSYLSFTDLKDKVCKLSKADRTNLINAKFQKETLVQERHMKVNIGDIPQSKIENYRYLLGMATKVTCSIDKFRFKQSSLLHFAHSILEKRGILMKLHVLVTDTFVIVPKYLRWADIVRMLDQIEDLSILYKNMLPCK